MDVNCVLALLLHVVFGVIVDVSGVRAASIFRLYPEDGDSMYVWKIGYIAHDRTAWKQKNRIDVDS